MKTTLLSLLAVGTCASVALAEPVSPAAGAKDSAPAEAHAAGPLALTEAEMDKITGGLLLPAIQAARESTTKTIKIKMTNHLISSYQLSGSGGD